ncbi:MAG: hypothetical protein KDA37_15045 [Planctomycetales bacterium]|nr:hypothetical protein [Planctomycetales bacterium]
MSYTDQAFIKAFRTDGLNEPPARAGATHTEESFHHGPHVKFDSGQKRPLSHAMNEPSRRLDFVQADPFVPPQREQPARSQREEQAIAGVCVQNVAVPSIVRELVELCGADYRRMLAFASRTGGVIGFLGAGEQVGCTTTALACALAVAESGAPVAVIDADIIKNGLARSLGFLHNRSIASTITHGSAAADSLVYSANENITFGLAFDQGASGQRPVSGALRSLLACHAAVLVDLGSDVESIVTHPARGADSLTLDSIILVRDAQAGGGEVAFAHRVLVAAGHTVVGVVDSFAA